ncbi:undecaprenyl-diphosphate phosphatase [Pseudoclavibacter caeni]|uniref:Undecaprenyl-diphosphatase n=1 Tax=Pseudoclavibacter caeni TaxID=908846 RepID=A0A7C8FIZ7_9MICO|nr:undecaprenyl-diphosphate phosphatase [Pseudoclavibacter caeni]KAB1632846.1 undecaprenyl-diphosphate phosphatase [Pseudoclavibacter caeni]NYJ97193.1 undecaprenyl-diphosphatase [Pseudoclavibacter caeni]
MSILDALILGLVQGLTEFLPISSSAHLRIVGELLPGAADPGSAFTAIIQLGTEAAVLVYFWRDIVRIVRAWAGSLAGRVARDDPDVRLGWVVIIGTIPIGVLGLVFKDTIETTLRSLWIVAIMLIAFGLLLGAVDRWAPSRKDLTDLTLRDGLLMGLAQALALIPGVSRSGGTTTAGRALAYDRPTAAKYSFYLAVPAVVLSGLFELVQALRGDTATIPAFWPTALATVVSFLVGWFVIDRLMKYLQHGSFTPFVIYRVVLGAVLLVLLGAGVLQA